MITLHFEIKWQAKHYISKTTVPMANKRGSMVTYLKWLPLIKLYNPLITLALLDHLTNLAGWWIKLKDSCLYSNLSLESRGLVWLSGKLKTYLYYLAPKLGKMMTCHEELALIKLIGPLISWFCEVTRHIKYFISPLALDQWLPNMGRWWITVTGVHS